MVLAISFLEAPLKFRAPGVTIAIGLGIGRLVFRALNLTETVLALAVIATVAAGDPPTAVIVLTAVVALLLAMQLAVIRPRLNRRSDRLLAGEDLPRSRTHLYYVALETAKVVALIGLGASILAA
jgi:membrane protein implicated in regulation of membrane protease activity